MDIKSAEPKESSAQKSMPGRRDFNYNMPMDMGRPQNFRPQYQNDYNGRGYQRNYQQRESKPYSHNKYDHYPQQQVMYPEYQVPYHQGEQPSVAIIPPYAPPAQPAQPQYSYKNYPTYNQPAQTQPSYKQSSYSSGGGNQYGGGSAGYGGGSRQPKDTMYEKNYAPQQNYQPYSKPHHNDPYMGGPSRDYQQSKNRYKPY